MRRLTVQNVSFALNLLSYIVVDDDDLFEDANNQVGAGYFAFH
jgi:hypothetical protein